MSYSSNTMPNRQQKTPDSIMISYATEIAQYQVKMIDLAFDMCVKLPTKNLNPNQKSCVENVIDRYVDTMNIAGQSITNE